MITFVLCVCVMIIRLEDYRNILTFDPFLSQAMEVSELNIIHFIDG